MNGLALCAGAGGLELGIGLAVPSYRTVCFVEREAFAAALLVARMEDGTLDPAPIWDDLLTFDGGPWRGGVDIVTAGFPCQPWSVAGSRRGTSDDRWIWPAIANIIRVVQPGLVFLENVPGLLAGGLGHVLGDLAALGFDAEWGCFRASDLGAPHRRERLFILAYPEGGRGSRGALHHHHHSSDEQGVADAQSDPGKGRSGSGTRPRRPERECGSMAQPQSEQVGFAGLAREGASLADAAGLRAGVEESAVAGGHEQDNRVPGAGGAAVAHPQRPRWEAPGGRAVQHAGGEPLAGRSEVGNTDGAGLEGRGRHAQPGALAAPWPPGPSGDWSDIPEDFWPATTAESGVRRVADGLAHRLDRLRALGNGVVPAVAAKAFRTLMEQTR